MRGGVNRFTVLTYVISLKNYFSIRRNAAETSLTPLVEPRNFLNSLAMLSASGSFSSVVTRSGSILDPGGFNAASLATACKSSASPVLILRLALGLPTGGGFRGGVTYPISSSCSRRRISRRFSRIICSRLRIASFGMGWTGFDDSLVLLLNDGLINPPPQNHPRVPSSNHN